MDEHGRLHASGIHCIGRIVLNMWRLLRSEVRLPIHTFESCAAAILQLRTPHVPAWQLSHWLNAGASGTFLPFSCLPLRQFSLFPNSILPFSFPSLVLSSPSLCVPLVCMLVRTLPPHAHRVGESAGPRCNSLVPAVHNLVQDHVEGLVSIRNHDFNFLT